MKYDYRDRQEWEEWLRGQTVKAIGQAVAVAVGILLCAVIAALTGCRSHKSVVTEQTTATTTATAVRDTTATTRDSTRTLTTWHTLRTDTAHTQTWHTITFAPTGGTLTIDSAGTVHAAGVTAYLARTDTRRTEKEVTRKAADSTAVAAHSVNIHTSRDSTHTASAVTATQSAALSWWQRTLMRIGQLALTALALAVPYTWLRRRK